MNGAADGETTTRSVHRAELESVISERVGKTWCLFLDRDGVINERIMEGYVQTSDGFVFLPGALGAIAILSHWAPRVVVVTNQQGIGKGLMTAAQLDQIHQRMKDDITAAGGRIDSIESCPHLTSDDCNCRKPRTGMAERYLSAHPEIDASLSIMVGDTESDIAMAGRLARLTGGCVSIRIDGHRDHLADGTYPTLAAFAAAVEPLLEDPDGAAGYSAE